MRLALMRIKARAYSTPGAAKFVHHGLMEKNPILEFKAWLAEAERAGVREPTAMALATSPKAIELRATPFAALWFHWQETKRQLRVQGKVEGVADGAADAYFASRPRLSRIGAWASRQSGPMTHSLELEEKCAGVALRYGIDDIPRPPFWSGFRVIPERIEFWSEKPFRRHGRKLYTRYSDQWRGQLLFP